MKDKILIVTEMIAELMQVIEMIAELMQGILS